MISEIMKIMDTMPTPCMLRDASFNCVYANKEIAELFGFYTSDEYIENLDSRTPQFQPDGSPSLSKFNVFMMDVLSTGDTLKIGWQYVKKDNEILPAEVTLMRLEDDGKKYVMAFVQDIRETKKTHAAERETKLRLQAMMDSCPVICGIADEHFNILEVNNEVGNLFGIFNKQWFIERFFQLSPEYQPDGQSSRRKALDKLKQAFEAGRVNYEWLHQNSKGEQIPCAVTLVRSRLNGQDRAIMYIRDLREVKNSIEQIEKMQTIAYTDELTGLFNRRYFMENAGKALETAKAENKPFHIIMVDLDFFKKVNDTYGHLIGDEVLKITAKRMSGVTHRNNIIARYGGEEFIICLPAMSHEAALDNAWRIQKTMEESAFKTCELSLNVTTSVGIATLADNNDSLDSLIHMADMALYGAKRTGRNKVMEYDEAKNLD